MHLNPYLSFNGQCEEAFNFYAQCLGGKIVAMLPFGDSPGCEDMPAEWRNKIMHARLMLENHVLMASDNPPGYQEEPKGISVSLHFDDPEEAERIYNALSDNGTIQMPLQETFWATRFGMFVDRFGIPWMVNCEKPNWNAGSEASQKAVA
ncbi:MAG: VOC family protein [Gammaproteobacteria bacterium]